MTDGNLIPCMIPQLDLFRKKPVQACITSRLVEKLKPIAAVPEIPDEIQFTSPGRPLHYLDINNLTLRVVVHMRTKSTGANLATGNDKYSVVDCTMHSLFSLCEISLSETPVTKSPHLYGYQGVFDIYTTSDADARAGPLSTVPVIPDKPADAIATNAAFLQRGKPYLKSQRVELIGKLRSDVCHMQDGLYILDRVPLRVKLTVQKQDFFIWANDATPDIELVFDDIELWVPYYVGNTELGLGIDAAVQEKPATYHFKGSQIKTFIHPSNTENINLPVAFNGRLPSTILFAMVAARDLNGRLTHNPFNFQHFGLQELSIFCNGVERRFIMNMNLEMGCSTVLRSLYADLGHEVEEVGGHVFTVDMLKNGRFACAADLTIDHSGRGPSQNLDLHGSVRIEGRLETGKDHSICILVYALYDSVLEIDSSRDVSLF